MSQPVTRVYLEVGGRKVFACALDWPGWCRAGRDEEAAPAALAAYGPRCAPVAARAGVPFGAARQATGLRVVDRVNGSGRTDFGAPDAVPGVDLESGPDGAGDRTAALGHAWEIQDRAAG